MTMIEIPPEARSDWLVTVARSRGFSFYHNESDAKQDLKCPELTGTYRLLPGEVLLVWEWHGEIFDSLQKAALYARDLPMPANKPNSRSLLIDDIIDFWTSLDNKTPDHYFTELDARLREGFTGYSKWTDSQIEEEWERLYWPDKSKIGGD